MLYLIVGFLFFVVLVLVLVFVVFKKSKNDAPDSKGKKAKKAPAETLEELIKILKTEKKELSRVEDTIDKMLADFPFPENEKEANRHFEYVYYFSKNPLPSAKLIVKMQKLLCEANPKYTKLIEEFQMRGVEARKK